MSQPDNTLTFLVADDEEISTDDSGTMGIFHRRSGEVEVRSAAVPVHRLRDNLVRACATLVSVLEDIGSSTTGGLKLREAQVNFEVSASGGVQFIGTGEVKGSGAITLIFKE
jgi:hypothetical protein